MNLIYGLNSGRGKAGKDTLIDLLIEDKKYHIHRYAFADELKKEVAKVISYTTLMEKEMLIRMHDQTTKDVEQFLLRGENLKESEYKMFLLTQDYDMKAPRSLRFHLQRYGTDYVQGFLGETDRWLNLVDKKITLTIEATQTQLLQDTHVHLVSDCRLEHELKFIKDINGTVIRIVRDWSTDIDVTEAHISDTALKDIELPTIINKFSKPEDMLRQFYAIIGEQT